MKVYVVNRTGKTVTEIKPGVAVFTLQPGKNLIEDVPGVHKIKGRDDIPYVKHSALEIARALVQDYGTGLELLVEADPEPVAEPVKVEENPAPRKPTETEVSDVLKKILASREEKVEEEKK